MAINIKFDLLGNPEPPTIILANRNGNKLGQLDVNVESIDLSDKLKGASEFTFTINKYVNGELTNLWDKIVDFKLVYCKEWDLWFEIKVELDESTETIKTVFCTQLGQAELSQIMLYNIEINTDKDIERDDYKISILYDKDNPKASILNRLLEKAPHYSVKYVDPTIARIKRNFSFDDTSICDALDNIEEEIGCLVVYDSNSNANGMPSRTISVYDLQQNCLNKDCGYRGEFIDECPKCGSKNIKNGYGEDTLIFVTADELASEGIQLVTDTDSVKNCFKLEGGDDDMTAAIRSCNPNGTDYIWYFSDDVKEDMSDELVQKIEDYDSEYKESYRTKVYNLDTTLLSEYNDLVGKYADYYNTKSTCLNCGHKDKFYDKCPQCESENLLLGDELQSISTPIVGYSALMNAYYDTIDLALYLKSGLMPSVEMSNTTASDELAKLTSAALSPVAVESIDNMSKSSANSAVLSMAKVIVKSTYRVKIKNPDKVSWDDNGDGTQTWSGGFIVTNYSDENDKAETEDSEFISVIINNDTQAFIEQLIKIKLNEEDPDDLSISGLFEKEYDVTKHFDAQDKWIYNENCGCAFCAELKKYALNPLNSFAKACDTYSSVLIEQGAGNKDEDSDLYDALYKPYYDKSVRIEAEIKKREDEIAAIEGSYKEDEDGNKVLVTKGLQTDINEQKQTIQDALNFEKYLGAELWNEFCLYRREDKYTNDNYTSGGLNNAELFKRALEFVDVAENEIYKSSELQHSISTSLNNLLVIPKFKSLVKSFKNGNWIRVQVDGKIYNLRLIEYGLSYGDLNNISVEFSDLTKIKNSTTDVQDIVSQASSIASSYDTIKRQSTQGNIAQSTIEQWLENGLNTANVQIQNNNNEEIIITKNGLLGRSYSDITGTYSPKQIKLTHNIIAYTDNNWQSVRTAIGEHNYKFYDTESHSFKDEVGYGMSADFVTAGIVSGSQIIGGDIYSDNYSITDEKGSYLNLRNGTFSFGGGALRFEIDQETGKGKLYISSDAANSNLTEINDEYLKTTTVYAQGLSVDAAHIQNQLTAKQINTTGLIAENISSTTIEGKSIIGGSLLIGKDNDLDTSYVEITSDGVFTANAGSIGGWVIDSEYIKSGDGVVGLYSGEGNLYQSSPIRFYAGNATPIDAPFYVTDNGFMKAASGSVGGWSVTQYGISKKSDDGLYVGLNSSGVKGQEASPDTKDSLIGSYRSPVRFYAGTDANEEDAVFAVLEDGSLYAGAVDIKGVIHANSGDIGGWNIDSEYIKSTNSMVALYSGTSRTDRYGSPIRFYAGHTMPHLAPFYVTESGYMRANSGGIGGWTIEDDLLKSNNGNVYLYSGNDITSNSLISPNQTSPIRLCAGANGQTKTTTVKHTFDSGGSVSYRYEPADCETITEITTPVLSSGAGGVSVDSGGVGYSYVVIIGNVTAGTTMEFSCTYLDKGCKFYVLDDGSLYAEASRIKGHIEATSGTIAGWNIGNGSFDEIQYYNDETGRGTGMQAPSTGTYSFAAGFTNPDSWNTAPFRVTHTGQLTAESVDITGGTIQLKDNSDKTVVLGKDGGLQVFDMSGLEGIFACAQYSSNVVRFGYTSTSMGTSITNTNTLLYNVYGTNKYMSVTGTWTGTSSGSIVSDATRKHNISLFDDRYDNFFDNIIPRRFMYNDGTSGRLHTGYIAQEVQTALQEARILESEFAAICSFDNGKGDEFMALRYEEFISLNTWQIQKLKKRVEELEKIIVEIQENKGEK